MAEVNTSATHDSAIPTTNEGASLSEGSSPKHALDLKEIGAADTTAAASATCPASSWFAMGRESSGGSCGWTAAPSSSNSACPVTKLACGVGRLACCAACLACRLSITGARALQPAVPLLDRLSDAHVKASAVVALSGLALLWRVCSPALVAELSFVSSAVKSSVHFMLMYALLNAPILRPTRVYSNDEMDTIRRRSAFVLCAVEVVQFLMLARSLPSSSAAPRQSYSAHVASAELSCCFTSCLVRLFVSSVFALHSVAFAVVLGAVTAVAAEGNLSGKIHTLREDVNERMATMPSACSMLAAAINGVCGPPPAAAASAAAGSSSSSAARGDASKCPFARFASSASALCPHPLAADTTAASSNGAIVPPASSIAAASSSSVAAPSSSPASQCPFHASSTVAGKACVFLSGIGSAALWLVRATQPTLDRLCHGEALNTSPAERRRATDEVAMEQPERHQPQPPLSPVLEDGTPSPDSPLPVAPSHVELSSPFVAAPASRASTSPSPTAAPSDAAAAAAESESAPAAVASVGGDVIKSDAAAAAAPVPSPDEDFELINRDDLSPEQQ